jgi:hypothetical protein
LKHSATEDFWRCLRSLPKPVQELARKNLALLKKNPRHPSLRFKKIGEYRSIRIGLGYRALAVESADGLVWFWIGDHAEYDRMVG